jgi:hypothetical protein
LAGERRIGAAALAFILFFAATPSTAAKQSIQRSLKNSQEPAALLRAGQHGRMRPMVVVRRKRLALYVAAGFRVLCARANG